MREEVAKQLLQELFALRREVAEIRAEVLARRVAMRAAEPAQAPPT